MGLATIELRERCLDWSRLYVVGILNVTPDSFSDGGKYDSVDEYVGAARAMAQAGADIIDIGGESTRPGAVAVDRAQELARVLPVIAAVARDIESEGLRVAISIDTTKAAVAQAALAVGAEIVNDISGGLFDPDIIEVTAAARAVYVCGHVRGETLTQVHEAERNPPSYDEVARSLARRMEQLPPTLRARTIIDPGLGFGKPTPNNLELMGRAGELSEHVGCPVMVGPSRKRFIRELVGDGADMSQRDLGTVGACLATAAGGAHLVRVHEVSTLMPALRVFEAATPPLPLPLPLPLPNKNNDNDNHNDSREEEAT